MNKSAEQLCQEREQENNGRHPAKNSGQSSCNSGIGYFPAKYTGITCQDAWYNYDKWLAAYKKTLQDFQLIWFINRIFLW